MRVLVETLRQAEAEEQLLIGLVQINEDLEADQGRTGDALALGGDEGRGKLRKSTGRCKRP